MSDKRIVVVGSANADLTLRVPKIPGPGETVLGGPFSVVPGGKGANQAVAASLAGGDVAFVARVGDDPFGRGGWSKDGCCSTAKTSPPCRITRCAGSGAAASP